LPPEAGKGPAAKDRGRDVGTVTYLMNVSLDGFVEDSGHTTEWTQVDEELHRWFNEEIRRADAFLYGRRVYELMAAHWPTADSDPSATETTLEFRRIWMDTPKVVFSSTLDRVEGNARLARGDVAEEVARLRTEFAGELQLAGPTLASAFIHAGLVDEYRLVVHPVVVGGGTPYFPPLDAPLVLRPAETRTFASGVRLLSYVPAGT
jgi:dihydrofolate reductase